MALAPTFTPQYTRTDWPSGQDDGEISRVDIRIDFPTIEEAREFAATFPKSRGVEGWGCSGSAKWSPQTTDRLGITEKAWENDPTYGNIIWGTAGLTAILRADGVNGGVNETGLKRLAKFLSELEQRGITELASH